MTTCPASDQGFFDVPTPSGYTVDWLGLIQLSHQSITFVPGTLVDKMNTHGLSPGTDYYIFIYDLSNSFIESYEAGTFGRKTQRRFTFPSPFENPFILDRVVDIKVAHPTSPNDNLPLGRVRAGDLQSNYSSSVRAAQATRTRLSSTR
jgi:hypothetical protein